MMTRSGTPWRRAASGGSRRELNGAGGARSFGKIIAEIDEPQTEQARHLSVQLDQGCADAAAAALRTGKKAKVTLALTFDASGQGRP